MTSKKRSKQRKLYQSTGVYGEEVLSGARPIEGVGTAVAAFVGLAPPNPKRAAAAVLAFVALFKDPAACAED